MENPDLVLQETGSRLTYSRLNYVPSGDTLRRDAISSFYMEYIKVSRGSVKYLSDDVYNIFIVYLINKILTKNQSTKYEFIVHSK